MVKQNAERIITNTDDNEHNECSVGDYKEYGEEDYKEQSEEECRKDS